jgi:hypothetical protein
VLHSRVWSKPQVTTLCCSSSRRVSKPRCKRRPG